jgi:hypothetical protein
MHLKPVMSTKTLTRALTVLFCLLVIFLTGRLLLPKAAPAAPVSDLLPIQRPPEVANREEKFGESKGEAERKVKHQDRPAREAAVRRQDQPEKPTTAAVPDPDMELVKGFLTKPLPRGTLEARQEVDKRMKDREKADSKLIKTDTVGGKRMRAYLVKQPSLEEVRDIMRPLVLFRNAQADAESKAYVDEVIQGFNSTIDPSSRDYKVMYALIPEGSGSIYYHSYAAKDEQDAIEILGVELNPQPRQVGVPYTPRDGETGVVANSSSTWRMDHFFEASETGHVRNH